MKRQFFLFAILLGFVAEITALIVFTTQESDLSQDVVEVNEAVQSVQADWDAIKNHKNHTDLDYVVLDKEGAVLYRTKHGLSENENAAVRHRDTLLDIKSGGQNVGRMIIDNNSVYLWQTQKQRTVIFISAVILVQAIFCIGYLLYLKRAVIRPFQKLERFAERVAGGNLDIPLEMDRQNLFGAFTESFDLMRSELKKARLAEAKANADKKELVAKLSHDIKTPVASIKAASEVGSALAKDERTQENYNQIIRKADQINSLITNLFTATLEELQQLPVTCTDIDSRELKTILENADYLHRAEIPDLPACLLYADRLRLQQVFDNIFVNSYKYANTEIMVSIYRGEDCLQIGVEDYGGGVSAEELPYIKEKFRRGDNAKDIEGAGLGLYISDYFMREMQGELTVENGEHGLKVIVTVSLSGLI